MLSGCDKDSHWGDGKEGKYESCNQFAKPLAFIISILKGYSDPQNLVWPLGSFHWRSGTVGLESQLTPPCPLCCCTLTSPLREGTAAPAASQLLRWEAMEALGESSDGAHLPEVTTWAVQPWLPVEMSMGTSVQSHLQRLNEAMGKPISLAFRVFSLSFVLLVCSNLHLPFPSCSPF